MQLYNNATMHSLSCINAATHKWNDTLIDPETTKSILEPLDANITFGEHRHRTPLKIFSGYMLPLFEEWNN